MRLFFFKIRYKKVKKFEKIYNMILKDIYEAIKENQNSPGQVITLVPLIYDLRKCAEHLVLQRKIYHILFFPWSERKISQILKKLIFLELMIKSKPINRQLKVT